MVWTATTQFAIHFEEANKLRGHNTGVEGAFQDFSQIKVL